MSCFLSVLIGHKIHICFLVEWQKGCSIHVPGILRFQIDVKGMLLIGRKVMLIVFWNAIVFSTESGNVFLFSVDLSDFRIESITKVEIDTGHKVLLINEVHNVKEGNNLCGIMTIIWYKIDFPTQDRMNYKLCRILRRVFAFIVVVHCFMQREKLFNFDKGWALNSDGRYSWKNSLVGYVSSLKKRVAFAENDSEWMIFQSSMLMLFLLWQIHTYFTRTTFPFFVQKAQNPYSEGVSFLRI